MGRSAQGPESKGAEILGSEGQPSPAHLGQTCKFPLWPEQVNYTVWVVSQAEPAEGYSIIMGCQPQLDTCARVCV